MINTKPHTWIKSQIRNSLSIYLSIYLLKSGQGNLPINNIEEYNERFRIQIFETAGWLYYLSCWLFCHDNPFIPKKNYAIYIYIYIYIWDLIIRMSRKGPKTVYHTHTHTHTHTHIYIYIYIYIFITFFNKRKDSQLRVAWHGTTDEIRCRETQSHGLMIFLILIFHHF